MMLARIAWKNIWRNPLRSGLLMLCILLGVLAGTFTMGFYTGLNRQRLRDKLDDRLSHLQIHAPAFADESDLTATLPRTAALHDWLGKSIQVKAWSGRAVIPSTARTAHGNSIIQLMAMDPEQESKVTSLHRKMISGDYFQTEKKLPVVLGASLAKELQVEEGKSVILDFLYPAGVFQSLKAKVVGVYKTNDRRFDAQQVYVPHISLEAAGVLQPGEVHEIGVMLDDPSSIGGVQAALQAEFPNVVVRQWKQIAPELAYIQDYLQLSMGIFIAVVMIAVGFVIANTLLMVVLERRRELVMLGSVGMRAGRIFWMMQLENLFIAMMAGPVGALLGYGTISHFGRVGIHVNSLEEGLYAFGVSTSIHPELETRYYLLISVGILATSLLTSALPAWRAARAKA